MNIERLYLDVLAGRKLDKVAEECWEVLGAKPVGQAFQPDDDGAGVRLESLTYILRHRYLLTLMNLAARKEAKPALADRVLAYLEAGEKAEPDEPRWKLSQYQLLVALDRPKDLEKKLREWIGADDLANTWRLSLGYLLAEQGKIAEAIKLFEAVRAADELRRPRLTARWPTGTWSSAAARPTIGPSIDAFKTTDEWRSSATGSRKSCGPGSGTATINRRPASWTSRCRWPSSPCSRNPAKPQNYLWLLQQFYQATRDFRLLAGLADSVVGHTAGEVYPFLRRHVSSVLSEVRDEATADSIVERIAEVRKRAKTPSRPAGVGPAGNARRAPRRGSHQNQPGPHVERALAALQRAWKRDWSAGEPRLMADLLASLGHISQSKLADEQVRELEELYRRSAHASPLPLGEGQGVRGERQEVTRHLATRSPSPQPSPGGRGGSETHALADSQVDRLHIGYAWPAPTGPTRGTTRRSTC